MFLFSSFQNVFVATWELAQTTKRITNKRESIEKSIKE